MQVKLSNNTNAATHSSSFQSADPRERHTSISGDSHFSLTGERILQLLNNKLDTVTQERRSKIQRNVTQLKERGKPERGKEEQQPARGGLPSQYSRASFRALPLMERNDPLKHRAGSGSWSYPSRKSSNLITVVLNFIAPFLVRNRQLCP